jgi:hypothetical protein
MTPGDETRAKLRALRDKLAAELPRARIRAGAPGELAQRLESALAQVSGVYLLGVSTAAPAPAGLDDAREDALVEGHLALHDWERWIEQEKQRRPKTTTYCRQHERQETNVEVRLLRYCLQDGGSLGTKLESESASRPARNVSLGGIFVAAAPDDLPEVRVGSVLHVSVSYGALSLKARAAVVRRDASGLGLRWIEESERVRRAIEVLLDAIRGARADR